MDSQEYKKQIAEHSSERKIAYLNISSIDGNANTATVKIDTTGNAQTKTINLPTYCSPSGVGLRFAPFVDTSGSHSIRVYQEAGEFIPMGFTSVNTSLIDNRDNTKVAVNPPLRFLNPGEVSLASGFYSEVFFSKAGAVSISDSQFDAIVIDPVMSTINLNAGNIKSELDGVRIRAGNIKRTVDPDSLDEMFLIKDGENAEQEFMVQVGTGVGIDGMDQSVPSVGFIGLGTRIADEQGRFYQLKDNDAQFLVKTASGGGIGISSTGSIYFMDYNSGSTTVFGSGESGDKWLRAGNNSMCVSATDGTSINSASGANIELATFDGSITLTEATGHYIQINPQGLAIDCGTSIASYTASRHTFLGAMSTVGSLSVGALPVFQVLRAEAFALLCFDIHAHPGPGAPPAIPLTPLIASMAVVSPNFTIS